MAEPDRPKEDPGRAPRVIAMAMLRGLLDAPTMQALLERPDPLEEALAHGLLDAEDVELLDALVLEQQDGRSRGGHDGDMPTLMGAEAPPDLDSMGSAALLEGRKVREAVTLPTWHHYRNLHFVAQGGMGRVFKAFDPQLRRRVALKFLVSDAPEMVRRLMLEAQLQAQVEHPGVCPVYEVGQWGGQAYIAMPFLKGQTLESAALGLSLAEKVQVMEQVAEAIHAAHRQGLIHRDLKPANIMVERTPSGLQPTILDFGLARGLEASGHTVAGLVIGTAHYMAPEMARGEHDLVSRRTDVYSLGAILHRLLTGSTLFPGAGGAEAIRLACDAEVPSLLRLKPDLPKDLDTLVRKCLALQPEQRYESAQAVAEDLRRWRTGQAILAQPPSVRYRTGKWIRRHRLTAAVSLVASLLLLLVLGITLGFRYLGQLQARHLERYRAEADQMEATLRYGYLLPLHDIQQEVGQVRHRLALIEGLLPKAGRAERGAIHYALGRGHLALGEDETARQHLEMAGSLGVGANEVDARLVAALGQGCERMLKEADRRMDPVHARRALREAEERYRKPAADLLARMGEVSRGGNAFQRAQLAYFRRDYAGALRELDEARSTHPWIYETRLLEGQILSVWGEAQAAGGDSTWADTLLRAKAVLADGRDLARSHPGFDLGVAQVDLRLLDAAVVSGKGAEGEFPALIGRIDACLEIDSMSPAVITLRARAGSLWLEWCLRHAQNPGQAVASIERTLELLDRRLPGHPTRQALQNYLDMGYGEYEMKHGGDPRPRFARAIGVLEEAVRRDPEDPEARRLLGMVLVRRGRYLSWCGADPIPDFARCVEVGESRGLSRQINARVNETAYHLSWLVHARLDAGQNPEAELARAIDLARKNVTEKPRSITDYRILAILLTQKGILLARQGREPEPAWEEAGTHLDRALAMDPHEGSSLSCRATLRIRQALHAAAHGQPFVHFEKGARSDAKAFFVRNPFQVELFTYLGELELGLPRPHGDPARAAALAKAVLARFPKNPEALENLRRAK